MKNNFLNKLTIYMVLVSLILAIGGCAKEDLDSLLSKQNPIEVELWHYYNGSIQNSFDKLVKEFNEGLGSELGLTVKAKSYGDVSELEKALYESANKHIGSAKMPHIFATYPDNASRISGLADLVPLDKYFSEEELDSGSVNLK